MKLRNSLLLICLLFMVLVIGGAGSSEDRGNLYVISGEVLDGEFFFDPVFLVDYEGEIYDTGEDYLMKFYSGELELGSVSFGLVENTFVFPAVVPLGTDRIAVYGDSEVYGKKISRSFPIVFDLRIEHVEDELFILRWDALDFDGDELKYNVYVFLNGRWEIYSLDYLEKEILFNIRAFNFESLKFKVEASDGFNVRSLESGFVSRGAVGETGRVSFEQSDGDSWGVVNLKNRYLNPVVIMQPLSYRGGQPVHVRLKEVSSDRFEFQIEEWDYLDGKHIIEEASYIVLESGRHLLEEGALIEAGKVSVNQDFKRVDFTNEFDSAPVVLTQSQSYNGGQAVVTRQRNFDSKGFEVRLQEEEKSNGIHAYEDVGYVAVEQFSDENFEFGFTGDRVKHDWFKVDFLGSYSDRPLFLASIMSYDGGDSAGLRYDKLTSNGVLVKVEEEQSLDAEVRHTSENVGYFVFSNERDIYGIKV